VSSSDDEPVPFACSLSREDRRDREAAIRSLFERGLIDTTRVPGGLRARFVAEPGTRDELVALAAAESDCCPFLNLEVTCADRVLVLDVTGPAEALPIITEMFPWAADAHRRKPRCPGQG